MAVVTLAIARVNRQVELALPQWIQRALAAGGRRCAILALRGWNWLQPRTENCDGDIRRLGQYVNEVATPPQIAALAPVTQKRRHL